MKDFFTQYKTTHKHPIFLPAIFALALSFSVVGMMRDPDLMRSISANVIEWMQQTPVYNADFLMEKVENDLIFRIGKNAENVKTLSFTLVGDPTKLTGVNTKNPNTHITSTTPWVALITVGIDKSLHAGDIVTTVTPILTGDTPLTLVDAGFDSDTGRYNLSTKVE